MSKLEQMARELHDAHGFPVWPTPECTQCMDAIRRVLLVLRTPDEGMVEAGHQYMPVEYEYWQEGCMLHAKMKKPQECVSAALPFAAMIDHLLKPE